MRALVKDVTVEADIANSPSPMSAFDPKGSARGWYREPGRRFDNRSAVSALIE
jgi:hypothetical protein